MFIETWLLDKSKYPNSKCGHMSKYGNLELLAITDIPHEDTQSPIRLSRV